MDWIENSNDTAFDCDLACVLPERVSRKPKRVLGGQELFVYLQPKPAGVLEQRRTMMVADISVRSTIHRWRPPVLLEQRPRALSMLWPHEQIYVPHRPVGERGVSRVGEPGTLKQDGLDIMSSQDGQRLMKQLFELQHLHHRDRRELP
jgi:hypothetical protein